MSQQDNRLKFRGQTRIQGIQEIWISPDGWKDYIFRGRILFRENVKIISAPGQTVMEWY
jgi:hypothetical protein